MLLWQWNEARNWPWVSELRGDGFGCDMALFCCFFCRAFFHPLKGSTQCSQLFSLDKIIFQVHPLWFPRGAVKQYAKPNLAKNYYLWGFLADVLGKILKLHLWAYYPATPQTSLWAWDEAAWTGFLFHSYTHYVSVCSVSQCLIWHKWSALIRAADVEGSTK